MPRLQDYELLLRMIPKVKLSYSREVLVELHIQKDSLQSSQEKLKKAIYILLNKNFNFNPLQKKQFSDLFKPNIKRKILVKNRNYLL